jgi:hypothetical protein
MHFKKELHPAEGPEKNINFIQQGTYQFHSAEGPEKNINSIQQRDLRKISISFSRGT